MVIATARDAANRSKRAASFVETCGQALAVLTAPGRRSHQLVCDRSAAEAPHWEDLVAAAAEQRGCAPLIMVSDHPVRRLPHGTQVIPADARHLEAALGTSEAGTGTSGGLTPFGESALRSGLHRGEIEARYQPMVRIADRKPMMVEALARWVPDRQPLGPEQFLAMAVKAGLMRPLSKAVAQAAVRDIGAARRSLRIGVTVNLPLELVLHGDLPTWLRQVLNRSSLRPCDLALELTEHMRVHDREALRRALRRIARAGHRVFLDDILADDDRSVLFDLPFAGLKLDRSLVSTLAESAHARQLVRRITHAADRRGQVVVAEGVCHPMQLNMLADLGIHWAQGFLIGRPLPARALFAWSELWRAGRPL
jgi:EAL domain-containing protein (putative c-di-GMP-specific phosphodiesterase class I)